MRINFEREDTRTIESVGAPASKSHLDGKHPFSIWKFVCLFYWFLFVFGAGRDSHNWFECVFSLLYGIVNDECVLLLDRPIHSSNVMISSFTIHNQPKAFQLFAVFNLSFQSVASALTIATHAHFEHWSFCYSNLRIFAVFFCCLILFFCRAPFPFIVFILIYLLMNLIFPVFNTNSVKRQMMLLFSYSKHIQAIYVLFSQ